jgi:hypothetical protein
MDPLMNYKDLASSGGQVSMCMTDTPCEVTDAPLEAGCSQVLWKLYL